MIGPAGRTRDYDLRRPLKKRKEKKEPFHSDAWSQTICMAGSDDYEKMFLECRRQQGQITALEGETVRLKSDLSTEQRARSKAVRSCLLQHAFHDAELATRSRVVAK